MLKTSKYFSVGHPDKLCDYICNYIYDRYLELDPMSQCSLSVQMKENFVNIAGEISSAAELDESRIDMFVKDAIAEVGYTGEYQQKWGKQNAICAEDIEVNQLISCGNKPKPVLDTWLASEVGWGVAVNTPQTNYMPLEQHLSKRICNLLQALDVGGIDILTQVSVNRGGIQSVSVEMPLYADVDKGYIRDIIGNLCINDNQNKIFINPDGNFAKHGTLRKCGTSGKCDFIDFRNPAVLLNTGDSGLVLCLIARFVALEYIKADPAMGEVYCSVSSAPKSDKINISLWDNCMNEINSYSRNVVPLDLVELFKLDKPCRCDMCNFGIFNII